MDVIGRVDIGTDLSIQVAALNWEDHPDSVCYGR